MKKLLALLLGVLLMFSLATTAFAAGETGTITITNATKGQTYYLYKIFNAVYVQDEDAAEGEDYYATYTIKTTDPQFQAIFGDPTKDPVSIYFGWKLLSEDENGVKEYQVTKLKTDDVIIGELKQLARNNKLQNPIVVPADDDHMTGDGMVIGGLEPGYYMVSSATNNGSLVTITNVKPNAVIIDKEQVPTGVDKAISKYDQNGAIEGWKDDFVSVEIGEKYSYRLTIGNAPNYVEGLDVETYVFQDAYGAGISPDVDSVKVFVKNGNAQEVQLGTDQYIVDNNADTNVLTITVPFSEEVFGKDNIKTSITVTFDAVLTDEAYVGKTLNDNNKNTVYGQATYDTDKTYDIGNDSVYVKTYTQAFTKVDGDTKDALEGVEFKLYADKDQADPVNLIEDQNIKGVYYVDNTVDNDDTNLIVTPENGKVVIIGMDAQEYFLFETKTKDGYNLPQYHFTLSAVEADMANFETQGQVYAEVDNMGNIENNKGEMLPETGAMGTIFLTTFGTILAIATAVLMITRKKMSVYED